MLLLARSVPTSVISHWYLEAVGTNWLRGENYRASDPRPVSHINPELPFRRVSTREQ